MGEDHRFYLFLNFLTMISHYWTLTKPRISFMVIIMSALGYFLGLQSVTLSWDLFWLLLGTGASCGGASTLNQVLEKDVDSMMKRTKGRPLPIGDVSAAHALGFGVLLILVGAVILGVGVNLLTAYIALLTAFLYVVVYTPLKKVTWLNTAIGAIPGALPPLGGWTAATHTIDPGGICLFLTLFVWQHPHFYAIAWMYKEDYKRAGLKMLPVVEPDGIRTFRHIVFYSIILLPVSLLPVYYGLSGKIYAIGAIAAGLLMLAPSIKLAQSHSVGDARRVLHASIVYLTTVFALILVDL
jgi:heme o synthase